MLSPKAIESKGIIQAQRLSDDQPQIQRGNPRKVLDAAAWVIGIPSKLILWDRRVDNHRIGPETEAAIATYLDTNGLGTTRVRINQYAPADDWRRLVRNDAVGIPWRCTLGAVSTLYETVWPGRLFGGDHYNPFTDTIHLYSDVPALALHEGGHAKDFARRKWKGTYAASYVLPIVPLYHESVASRDVMAYVKTLGTPEQQREACRILYPAYGTYVGSAFGAIAPRYGDPIYLGSVVAGHFWGRSEARKFADFDPR